MNSVEVGQIWDDVFGKWTYKVVAKTEYNVVLRRLEYGNESLTETLKPLHTFRDGGGWRLISNPDRTTETDVEIGALRALEARIRRIENPPDHRGWCYEEKDAWYSFKEQNPEEAKVISNLVSSIWIKKAAEQTDYILKGGYQVEVLMLRLACLLGLTTYDWYDLTGESK